MPLSHSIAPLFSNEKVAETRYQFTDNPGTFEDEEQDLYDRFPDRLSHAEFWKHLNGYVYKWDLLHWYRNKHYTQKALTRLTRLRKLNGWLMRQEIDFLHRAYPEEAEALRSMNYRAIGFCLGAHDGTG